MLKDMTKQTIKKRLDFLIKKRGVSNSYVAKSCGSTEAAVRYWRNPDDTRVPSARYVPGICYALGCEPDWLLGIDHTKIWQTRRFFDLNERKEVE